MASWHNWSGKVSATPSSIHHVRSEADAAAVVADATTTGTVVRAVGAGHSHAPLVPTDGVIVDTSGLAGLVSVDHDTDRAWMWAGTPIHALGRVLHDAGLALANQGDIDRQTIGGSVATGTHGTGATLTNLSAQVTGARIIVPGGELMTCSADEQPDLWRVAQLNLGAAGLVTQLELQLRPPYRLRQTSRTSSLDEALATLDHDIDAHRHFELFWFPTRDRAFAKITDETTDPPSYPIGPEGGRCGWNYEVLPSRRDWPHTEMEYSVPLSRGAACLDALRDLLAASHPSMPHPVEYRAVAPDDVWLSPACGRATATISVHVDASEDDRPLFRDCEELFTSFDGRPHWGKVHFLDGAGLASRHPHWERWWAVRDHHDPTGIFLNDHLRRLRSGSTP